MQYNKYVAKVLFVFEFYRQWNGYRSETAKRKEILKMYGLMNRWTQPSLGFFLYTCYIYKWGLQQLQSKNIAQ